MEWADDIRTLKVRVNADNPEDSKKALEMGAEGIGLCRTEHMFFGDGRIDLMREMILADNKQTRVKVLQDLMPFQKKDFAGILKAMDGLPVTIRLIDPPLHEFLPRTKEDMEEFCQRTGWDYKRLRKKVETMEETNPMLGHRGCRLGIVYPEIIEMQVKAILEAVVELKQQGYNPRPEIEVPLVQNPKELEIVVDVINKTAEEAGVDKKDYILATMIELPRACVVADKLVKQVDLLSFGTNDLTQTTMGISRDDGNRFIGEYVANDIFAGNPFQQLDLDGVGVLIQVAVLKSRKVKPEVEIGVCGEHGGDPFSIEFFQRADFDFVSCSLYRLPIARLAAAQAAIKYPESE